jgi:3-hydroxybutyryl-CoA dehydrogenase
MADGWGEGPLTVGVVGAGAMGRGIAQVLALAGVRVLLTDARQGAAAEAASFVGGMLDRLATKGRVSTADAQAARERLGVAGPAPEELAGADLVVEAVVEDLAVKRALFASLEEVVSPDAVLATNTSSLSVTSIASGLRHPERVCGLHFFNPVPLMKLAEVVAGERTAPSVVERLLVLVERIGHTAVRVADTPGFLVNHAGRAYSTEALRLLDEGVAPPYDIDAILRDAAGFRMGPFELFDLTGLDVSQPVMESVWSGFYGDPRLRPSPTGRRRLAAGRLGRKTGEGFYAYGSEGAVVPETPPAPAYDGTPVYISAAEPEAGLLGELLRSAGVTVVADEAGSDAVAVVTPWGRDVTSAALEHMLRPERTVGVDPFGAYAGRLTLAGTPATPASVVRSAWGALAATGRPVTVVQDSPGFVAQRVFACVVNLASEIAQLGIASPGDIDTAVRLGLGYPHGPLAWGDALGAARVLEVLDGLWEATRDPRYRPSMWLSRRARLGLSLLDEPPVV